jgi:predicted TIM-barrel fold metal-dependent hydrolase
MIIDAHNHPDWLGHDLDQYLENMAQYSIDATWLLTWEAPEDEYSPLYRKHCPHIGLDGPIAFARALSYKERQPDKFVLGYAPDPRRPDAIDRLAGAVETYGVQVYGELKLRMCYDNPDALRMFRFCGEKGLPVTVHIDYEFDQANPYPRPNYWYGGGFAAFERAVRACPETIFLGHAPGFWAHISGDDKYDKEPYPSGPVAADGRVVTTLRECPNLWCDLSAGSGLRALARDESFAKEFILEFQDRILYARDCFDNQHQEFLNKLDLAEDVLAKIYSGNALRLAPMK